MGEKEETEAVVVFGDGGGEERMTEEEEEGYLTLTDLGERLLILGGCTNVFLHKRWDVFTWGWGGVIKTLEDICTKVADKNRPPFNISALFSWLWRKDSNLRNTVC